MSADKTAPETAPGTTAQLIDRIAADWVARIDQGVLSAEDDAELSFWLARDTRHAGAFARARAISLYSERAAALGPGYDPKDFSAPPQALTRAPISRRHFLMAGASVAAGIGGAAVLGVAAYGQDYMTGLGEMKIVPLADGSVISLNTDSRVHVHYSRHQRMIRLDKGEALFDVAKDAARPFRVQAGDTEVTAVGTSFTVRRLSDTPVQVLVREGVVDVHRDESRAPPLRVRANTRIVAASVEADDTPVQGATGLTAMPISSADLSRALAWRDGRIVFEDDTLAEASQAFMRYSATRIVIDDPVIANMEITGLFQANDPVGFARAAADSLGLRTEIGENQVRLYR